LDRFILQGRRTFPGFVASVSLPPALSCRLWRDGNSGATLKQQRSPVSRTLVIAALKANPIATRVAGQVGGVSQVTVWKIAKAEGIELTRRHHRDAGSTGSEQAQIDAEEA
jgi:hypothetical protein